MMRLMTLLLCFVSITVFAQEFKVDFDTAEKGYQYPNRPFPQGVDVYDLDKNKYTLNPDGVTLIQIWSLDAGGEPAQYLRILQLAETYKAAGLVTYSINFENAMPAKVQRERLRTFFQQNPKPDKAYYDNWGVVPDLLKPPGFPTYMIVDKGRIVYVTRGSSEEGLKILESELATRLEG